MHGLCLRALQSFLRDRFGDGLWADVARAAALPDAVASGGFDVLRVYDAALGERLLAAAERATGIEGDMLLEDLGTYLVSHPSCEAIRRLLRFGGPDVGEFLLGLGDLPDRARLAVAELDLPRITTRAEGGAWRVDVAPEPGFAAVLTGVIRAVADDYGALAVLSRDGDSIEVRLVDTSFAEGRRFALAG